MNNISKYYIVELIEDVCNPWNVDEYSKDWTVNTNDNFKTNCAKKMYEFIGREI